MLFGAILKLTAQNKYRNFSIKSEVQVVNLKTSSSSPLSPFLSINASKATQKISPDSPGKDLSSVNFIRQ
jgi:hypothetical protein